MALPTITVALVEDHPDLRTSLSLILEGALGFRFVGAFANGREARKGITATRPHVVLMDIMLPDTNGVDLVRELKPALPNTQFIMLTVLRDPERLLAALQAGATGYLLKHTPAAEVLTAIRDVHAGGSPMSPAIARLVVNSFRERPAAREALPDLTAREREVLGLLAKGLLYKEIADQLGISYETVHTHIRVIYEKLQVRSRTQAVARYLEGGSILRPAGDDVRNPPPP